MLDHYHTLVRTLNDAESALLDDHSQELLRVFRSGFKRLNWNSLGDASACGRAAFSFGRGLVSGHGTRGRRPRGSITSSRGLSQEWGGGGCCLHIR